MTIEQGLTLRLGTSTFTIFFSAKVQKTLGRKSSLALTRNVLCMILLKDDGKNIFDLSLGLARLKCVNPV